MTRMLEARSVARMLEARSVALVGASQRTGSLGERMVAQVSASPSKPRLHLVNPRYGEIGGIRCLPRLADVPEAVDLVLLGVPDTALDEQLSVAAGRGDRSAVIFGSAFDVPGQPPGLRARLAATARAAGMALCGAGCMGFVNVARGLRAVGYLEPDPLPAGPAALVTHSGSVFSALLRNRRGIGFSVAVSSGQELVTTAAAYARYALKLPETRVLALVLEAIRDAGLLRAVLGDAAAAGVPVVLLTAGASDRGRALVSAHSGALAAGDGAWEALADAYGLHRVGDLAELADTLELFAIGRRGPGAGATAGPGGGAGPGSAAGASASPGGGGEPRSGIATVHDSGLERAHVADLADELGVPFAAIGSRTRDRLAEVLDPGLEPANPLDVWGTGRDAERQLADSLTVLAEDPAVAAVALAVDLVPEFDGDESYPRALLAAAARTSKPLAVLAGLPASIDPAAAARLRATGIPVLEGARTGLLALRHLLDHASRAPRSPQAGTGRAAREAPGPQAGASRRAGEAPGPGPAAQAAPPAFDPERRRRWGRALASGPLGGAVLADLLRDYGIPAARTRAAASREAALAAAAEIGYPVVLKTGEPGVAHKSDAGGVLVGLGGPDAVAAGYQELAGRLGPRVLVCATAAAGTEIILGVARDPALGPLLVVGAGGVLVELLADRVVALPPVDRRGALRMLSRLRAAALLAGLRGQPAADLGSVANAITGLSAIASELGDELDAFDINPLICGPAGAVAVDARAVRRRS
jgi:acyl-CoA synthetase (NDP forming)